MQNNRHHKPLIMIPVLAVLISFAGFSCHSDTKKNAAQEKEAAGLTFQNTDTAKIEKATQWYDAVGTIRPRTETSIEAQVPAQITKVLISPGSKVKKGDTLFILDDRQFATKRVSAREGLTAAQAAKEQANQALIAAKANFTQAEAEYARVKKYFETQAATAQQLEMAKANYITAESGVKRAKEALIAAEAGIKQAGQGIKESEIAVGYTVIKAPDSGEVLKRMAEPGDMAMPGKTLAVLRTSGSLRIEAYVREGLIAKVTPGTELEVDLTTLEKKVKANVSEIVPYADPRTRTFLVKADLPAIQGVYPGMYAKLLIPVMESDVITIPAKAVKTVGQLQLVMVKENDQWRTRYIKAGNPVGTDRMEVLSGLTGTETVGY